MENEAKYVPLRGFVVPVYRFIEGEDEEQFWVDAQNCEYYTYNDKDFDEKTQLIEGKNWWIMWPHIPEGTKPQDVTREITRWFVEESSVATDVNKEWDFETHKPKES